MGEEYNNTKSHESRHPSKLSLPNDNLLRNKRKSQYARINPSPAELADHIPAQTLAPVVSLEVIQENILPVITQLVEDPIPNIRFNVAKSYGALVDVLRSLPADGGPLPNGEIAPPGTEPSPTALEVIQKDVIPALEKLQADEDIDVRYFAGQATAKLPDAMHTSP